jgi:hypothetical protein
VLEAWYQDVISRTGDEESWTSGVLGMKTLDRSRDFNGKLQYIPCLFHLI